MNLTLQELLAGSKIEFKQVRRVTARAARTEVADVIRPGIELAGHLKDTPRNALSILGRKEINYLADDRRGAKVRALERFLATRPLAVVIADGIDPPKKLVDAARKHRVPVLRSSLNVTNIHHRLMNRFMDAKTPCIQIHGDFLDVFGVGVLITGEPGVGKSECALELIERGHRLVADDIVNVRRIAGRILMGSCPDRIKHLLEVRGLGIVDVMHLYGVGAVRSRKRMVLVIQLEDWGPTRKYDRVELEQRMYTLLEVELPLLIIPVKPGRPVATLVEVAAKNQRLKRLGIDSAALLDKQIKKEMGLEPER